MATTSTWSIKNNLKNSLDYIINPEKTINNNYGKNYDYNFLEMNKDYNFKTEKTHYVSYLNCLEDKAFDDMMFTKKRFGKTNKILAFHTYQSFKEGEVTADIAHEIGVKLADELWKDFEVIIATHQNTNHIHNHFIINSVSFKTGKKYNNNKSSYAKVRSFSDSLCQEYGLSSLKEDIRYTNSLNNILKDNDYYIIAKEDLDYAISISTSNKQFFNTLQQLDYKYYIRNNVLTIYKENQDKIRTEKIFGKEYSLEQIKEKLYDLKNKKYHNFNKKSVYINYFLKYNKKPKSLYALYIQYCYLLKIFPKEYPKQYLPDYIRKEIKKLEQISEETRFITNNNIVTISDLVKYDINNSNKLSELVVKRKNLRRKFNRTKNDFIKKQIDDEIKVLQPQIKELYKIKKCCNNIKNRYNIIKDNIELFEKKIKNEYGLVKEKLLIKR